MARKKINIEDIDAHNAAIRAFNRLSLAKVDLYLKGKKINLTPFRIRAINDLLCMDNSKAVEMRAWKNIPAKAPSTRKTKKPQAKKDSPKPTEMIPSHSPSNRGLADDYYDRIRTNDARFSSGGRGDTY